MKIYQPAFMLQHIGWKRLPYCQTKEIAEYALELINKHFNIIDSNITELNLFDQNEIEDYINNRLTLQIWSWDKYDDQTLEMHEGKIYRWSSSDEVDKKLLSVLK